MSYNQKPPGPSGSGMGGGPPNGPNNIPQVAKTFAGIQQQMQNLVHGQNAIPQSSQADINAFLQQQRIQNMLKQQQQFLQFQHQMQAQQQQQQQQHQQQQQQLHNMPGGGGGGVGAGPVGGPVGVGAGGAGSGGAGGSGEPLALTRTPGAAELLNKTYQQQANGNPAANPAFNLQQTLQALPTNFVQQLQAFQYQMQAKQMQQQQQHGGGQGHQGGHGQQQQPVQGVPAPPPPTTSAMTHQQQQHQQKHQQHQHQQQQNAAALSTVAAVQQLQQRYLTAAAAAVSGNKISSATPPPPPPPLTNQMKPPNLPPNTQITPVSAANVGSNNMSGSSGSAGGGQHSKSSAGNTNTGMAKHQAPPPPTPSISLTPSKQNTSTPSVAHQQNKFMPPTNSGGKGGHSGHSQNLAKSTHGGGQTSSSNPTSPAKTGTNADGAGAAAAAAAAAAATASALKSPQSTPVQLTKQAATVASTTVTSKSGVNTTAGVTAAPMVSPQKSTVPTTTVTPIASNTTATSTTTATPTNSNTSQAKPIVTKPTTEDVAKTQIKSLATREKEVPKLPIKDGTKKPTDATTPVSLCTGNNKNETEKQLIENKLETAITPKTPVPASASINQLSVKTSNEVTNKTAVTDATATDATVTVGVTKIESKAPSTTVENKLDAVSNIKKPENHSLDPSKDEAEKKSTDAKKIQEKNKPPSITEEKPTTPVNTSSQQETSKKPESISNDDKKPANQIKKLNDEIKTDKNSEETLVPEKKAKSFKTSKIGGESSNAKDTSKLEIETDKLNTAAAIISSTTTTSKTTTSLAITVTSTEKVDVNVKNVLETSQKNDKQPLETNVDEQHKDKEKEPPIISNADEKEKSTETLDNLKVDAVKEVTVKDKEEPTKHNKTNEKSESTIPVKSVSSTKANNDDTTIRETKESAQKEIAATAATPPVKKLGRLPKAAKSKTASAPPATVADGVTSETKLEEKPTASSSRVKRKSKTETSYVFDSAPSTPKDDDLDRKSKRHRLKTILYQSPLPELAYITKLSASEASNSPKPMSNEDRLIVFYKNEYMAVRNSEGTFYLCQTMQNVYRTSPRISIRWLSEDAKDNNVYIPDFYDHTDIECVLTTVELKRIDKGHLRLPKTERIRIENILKKAIDVEKGIVPRPDLTEENPDGLDISLYKDESQIEKKSSADSESVTPSSTTGRKLRKSHAVAASSSRKSSANATPSTSLAGKKRKRGVSSVASTSNARKSPLKKRKTLLKRKKKISMDLSDDEDDDETSDDCESDAEYKPTQKRSSLNTSAAGSKMTPRAQRSPLAKARAASPITPTTSRSKNVPQKITPTASTSKVSRGERAAKRKSYIDAGSSEENQTPVKKPMTSSTSTNNGKTTNNNKNNKVASTNNSNTTTTPVKKSLNDSKTSDFTNTNTTMTITSPIIPNPSEPASSTNSSKTGKNGVNDSSAGGGSIDNSVNRPARSRK